MSSYPGKLLNLAGSLLNFRYLVVISSVLFFTVIGIAFLMVYQNARAMRDRINDDFNQQQLILAKQEASQINALLSDFEAEIESLRKDLAASGVIREAMERAFERTRAKGVIETGMISGDRVIEDFGAPGNGQFDPRKIPIECRFDPDRMIIGPTLPEFLGTGGAKPRESDFAVTSMLCAQIKDHEKSATLFFKLDVTRLIANLSHEIRSGKTGYAWAIDETGMFLYHPDKEFIGKNAFTVRQERKPYISFSQINRIMQDQMLRGEEGTGIYISGWHRGIQGEIKKLIAFTPVHSNTLPAGRVWSVAVAAPISEVAGAVHDVYIRHFAAEAAIILGMFVFGVLLAIYQQKISQTLKEQVKRTKADLHETERIYKRVVEQATDHIYILDLDMRIVLLNRPSIETFSNLMISGTGEGQIPADADLGRPETYIGKKLNNIMLPADAGFMRKQIDRVLAAKSSISYEHSIGAHGRKVRLSTKVIPIRNDDGVINYVLGISRDVTEKTELDQRIYNTEKLASIGTLAAGVAHEINNPLAVILGFTDLLIEKFPPGSPESEDLKIIEYNSRHAKQIVENLLTFARITEGLDDTIDIKSSVETVIQIIKNTLMTKKVELSVDMPENLPRVKGDSREFQQVIFNLINNAVAAMEKTGGRLILNFAVENGWVNMSVTDTGVGIPDRVKPHIFDPFFTTKKVGEGTGLGLSLCYGIVKKYGGKITFSSVSAEDRPDSATGTTFNVLMPIYMPVENGEEKP